MSPERHPHGAGSDAPCAPGLALLVVVLLLGAAGLVVLALWRRDAVMRIVTAAYDLIVDRQSLAAWLAEWGMAAPAVFIGLQVAQVLLAPVPGEATGFIGGYLFGAGLGFVFSTIGLTLGSWLNFALSRRLGRGPVRRWVGERHLERFDLIMRRQGTLAALVMFVIPGFPKDYLCLFLGLSRMPLRLFLPLVAVGRIPGTLLLSFQGAALADRRYGVLAVLGAGCLIVLGLVYAYRETLYSWIERLDNGQV